MDTLSQSQEIQAQLQKKGVYAKLVPIYKKKKIVGYMIVTGEYDSKEEANKHSQFLNTLNIPYEIKKLPVYRGTKKKP